MISCPLCQKEFDDRTACKGCGLTKGCTLIKCPNCGYEFVTQSAIVNFFTKLINRFKKRAQKELEK